MTLDIKKDSIDLGIVTKDVEPMLAFYRDTLGLQYESVFEMPGGGRMTRLLCGSSVIKLVVHGREPKAEAPPGGINGATGYRYFTIAVGNIEDATQACKDAGYRVVIPVTEIVPGKSISMIEDPDGNWVELLQDA